MSDPGDIGVLTPFQVRIARLFFTLPASGGFLLAGERTDALRDLWSAERSGEHSKQDEGRSLRVV